MVITVVFKLHLSLATGVIVIRLTSFGSSYQKLSNVYCRISRSFGGRFSF